VKAMASDAVRFNIIGSIFLSFIGHFLPPWADYILTVLVLLVNLNIAAKLNFEIPAWFAMLILLQISSLISGFHTDHDPFDGEWGGKSEPNEWF
jgi:hypothetical protein